MQDRIEYFEDQTYYLQKDMNDLQQRSRRNNIGVVGISDEIPKENLENMLVCVSLSNWVLPEDNQASTRPFLFTKRRDFRLFPWWLGDINLCGEFSNSHICHWKKSIFINFFIDSNDYFRIMAHQSVEYGINTRRRRSNVASNVWESFCGSGIDQSGFVVKFINHEIGKYFSW